MQLTTGGITPGGGWRLTIRLPQTVATSFLLPTHRTQRNIHQTTHLSWKTKFSGIGVVIGDQRQRSTRQTRKHVSSLVYTELLWTGFEYPCYSWRLQLKMTAVLEGRKIYISDKKNSSHLLTPPTSCQNRPTSTRRTAGKYAEMDGTSSLRRRTQF